MTTLLTESYLQRFGGLSRLYGIDALPALNRAHFVVIGLGGVGSWTAEALARSGVGTLTLIELDDICITNTNRQIHALDHEIGQPKNQVLSARLKDINPEIKIHCIDDFLTLKNITHLINPEHDVVIDAMDSVAVKAGLVSYCSARKIRLIIVGSSGGKRDPLQITCADLAKTESDPMLAKIRYELFKKYKFSKDGKRKFRVDAIYSSEQMVYPKPDGSVCMNKQFLTQGVKLDCASGFGSSTMVTGSFGFAAATKAIERYLTKALE